MIPVGTKFALIEGAKKWHEDHETKVEVMVCWKCRDVDLPEKERQKAVMYANRRELEIELGLRRRHGCFVVNGRIVP